MLWARRTQKTAISAPYIRTVFLLTLKRCGDIMRKHVADIISVSLSLFLILHTWCSILWLPCTMQVLNIRSCWSRLGFNLHLKNITTLVQFSSNFKIPCLYPTSASKGSEGLILICYQSWKKDKDLISKSSCLLMKNFADG